MLALWLFLHSVDLGSVPGLIGRGAPSGLGLAGLVVAVQFLVLVERWQLVIRILGGEAVGVGPLALLLGRSLLIGQVLTSVVGGDVAWTVMLARMTGATAAARSVVCDRLLGFASLTLIVLPTLPLIAGKIGSLTPFLTLTIAGPGSMAAVALVLVAASYGWGVRKGALAAAFSLVQVRSRGEWPRPPSCSD